MTPEVLSWLAILGSVGVLFLVGVVSWREFNKKFEKHVYKLRPKDLKDPAYQEALRGALTYHDLAASRRFYLSLSLAILVGVACSVAFVGIVHYYVSQLFPPILFGLLKPTAQEVSAVKLFRTISFFAVAFHAVPFLTLLLSKRSGSADGAASEQNAALRVLTILFAWQQIILHQIMADLLELPGSQDTEAAHAPTGSISEGIKGRIAEAMTSGPDAHKQEVRLGEAYVEWAGKGPQAGVAVAAVLNVAPPAPPSSHQMVLALIQSYGIPQTRRLLKWKHDRLEDREIVMQAVAGEINGVAFGDTDDAGRNKAWMVDIGKTSRRGKAKSFLVRIPNPSAQLQVQAQPDACIRITSIGQGRRARVRRPFDCNIRRAPYNSPSLYVGAVVQNCEWRRFTSALRATRPAKAG